MAVSAKMAKIGINNGEMAAIEQRGAQAAASAIIGKIGEENQPA
jgi:hypothetical protein